MHRLTPPLPLRNSPVVFFLLTLIANLLLLKVTDEKSWLAVTFFYILSLFTLKLSLSAVMLLTFIFCLPFEHGLRGWILTAAMPRLGFARFFETIYFGFSLKFFLAIAGIAFIFANRQKLNFIPSRLILFLWLSWITLILVSTQLSPRTDLAWAGYLKLIVAIASFFIALHHSKQSPRIFQLIMLAFSASFCLQLFVINYQTIFKHSFGTSLLEDTKQHSYFTTDGTRLNRYSGLMGHPTFLSSWLTILFPLVFVSLSTLTPSRYRYLTPISLILLTGFALYGTLSRSGLVVFLFTLILLLVHNFQKTHLFIYGLPVLLLVPLANFWPRLSSLSSAFSTGSGVARIQLVKESFHIIRQYPLLGTGFHQFTTALMDNYQYETIVHQFSTVHNTWLILAAETGIPATILVITIFILILSFTFKKLSSHPTLTPIWLGVIIFIIQSQFHPLLLQDSTFEYTLFLLGILAAHYET